MRRGWLKRSIIKDVCSIYEVGSRTTAYIVMQYIPGKSLDKVIAEGSRRYAAGAVGGIQISDGLAAAHQAQGDISSGLEAGECRTPER